MTTKVTVSTKGHLIDAHCQYSANGVILESDGQIYDCTLNQTDIGSNKNKFYIIQIIKSGNQYVFYTRYGRVGVKGKVSHKIFTTEQSAINEFGRIFRTKTGNSWHNKDNFVKVTGKYHMALLDYADEDTDIENSQSDDDQSADDSDDEIDPKVENFLKIITNTIYMNNTLVELEIDVEKMPLGKISQSQIDTGFQILNKINKNLNNKSKLIALSSEFYTLIPIACGRNKPPVIDNKKLLSKNINMLNELSQMVYGTKAITKLGKNKTSLVNTYNDLHTEIIPLEKSDTMYKILAKYITNSKAPTHYFDYTITDIYQIDRDGERDQYDEMTENLNNKMLLFHGTRTSNIVGILQNGLVCDPSKLGINVSITGKMFGLGVYFANTVSKSIQYCAHDTSDNIACIFICEVALGNMLEKTQSDYTLTAKTLPKKYQSVWGLGKSSYTNFDEYDDSTQIPSGPIKVVPKSDNRSLLYDEFIVYHEEQINLRYIAVLKIK